MGCLNSNENFNHWFGNIHLSGPCNRACYFCIGQHMMALDKLNNLDKWPLENIDEFIAECKHHNVSEINITGSNTDPLLYKHFDELYAYLKHHIPHLTFGLRTNGVLALPREDVLKYFDKMSISITSFAPDLYKQTMGMGRAPLVKEILRVFNRPVKLNVVLCRETVVDFWDTLDTAANLGIKKVNLREPYGQSHIGDPLHNKLPVHKTVHGMPCYIYRGMEVTYWDVHYVEVESVNLYANGIVSVTYPVTKGHDPVTGMVKDQSNFTTGRHREQWVYEA